ncbi:Alcohol dehydrogenase [Nocardia seriolae]|uniref:Alcohol dehydrogenase n=1 Tax=Nocardia seriolae TaxID=37332 RepID=A0ABC8B0T7_9NOCA|nr:Alcohol dehydrogenase [Nocardia seriolae]GEM23028.1 putative oxidoreductase [Nocardia seriolae NBRC 15557]BEK89855.1 NADP-dependent oxidoreductase [Nocardia seriolae]BEK94528.1 NADP-dependent oxidoreductase [Nocardia seriolae]GAM45155.1 NADPH:quinone reductase [Nocardia seriolae]
MSLIEIEVPEPGPGEVTVAVRAAGVNPFDYKVYSGAFGTDPGKLPMRLGLEVSGVVTAVGSDAVGPAGPIAVGDEVIAPVSGGYATAVNARAAVVVPKPADVEWKQAAGVLSVGGTAVHLLTATGVGPGDTVLVHGAAGSVGALAAQLAVARGARVIGTASASRHERLRAYGVEPVEYGPGLADRVKALAPNGIDAALDTVGTDEAVDVSLELVADRSRIASIVAFGRAAADGFKVLGMGPGADPGTEIRGNTWRELLPLLSAGKLDLAIAKTFPLAEVAAAHDFVRDGHAGGKVILLP